MRKLFAAALCAVLPAASFADDHGNSLATVLDAQPDEVRARYEYRHPAETLTFFGIKPGMTVVEALPGGGWYSKILLPYLGEGGKLVGADYNPTLYANFSFMTPERLKAKETWVADWTADARGWAEGSGADVGAYVFGELPEAMHGTADAALFIRAFHNLARFNSDGGHLDTAIQNTWDILKPGGVVGIVQHEARAEMPDAWADGSRGYLKQSFIIEQLEKAGFELVGSSDVNTNAKDQPTEDDIVWRLPPSLSTSRENPELAAKLREVGESNRMTLLFRKPA